ncbi:MAG TPA: imidazole glycerol phosphate synthase subunit HisH [Steroidobacteraceae bacterium]|nr:imidazole glycerol phosphate synthase subunit HisH [Steroidobacteraceae bacterium]
MSDAVIVDSGGANLASLKFALERLGAAARVTSRAEEIRTAPRVLLPGVGSAPDAMQRLRAAGLTDLLPALTQPVLGICLGMQLLYARSAEGDIPCLGIVQGEVCRLTPARGRPVPHMGWNGIEPLRSDALTEGMEPTDYVYFVHSFAAPVSAATVAAVDYGGALSAVVRERNFWGVQFHPERSGRAGARILQNFLRLAA